MDGSPFQALSLFVWDSTLKEHFNQKGLKALMMLHSAGPRRPFLSLSLTTVRLILSFESMLQRGYCKKPFFPPQTFQHAKNYSFLHDHKLLDS